MREPRNRAVTASIAASLTALSLALAAVGGVSAAGNTMRIDPATQTVAKGATVTVRIIQNASVDTAGTQASVTFDKAKLKLTTVTKGAGHPDAAFFLGADAASITAANAKGKLAAVATGYLPPTVVPPGDAEFVVLQFTAIGCGSSKLGMPVGNADSVMLDARDESKPIKPTTTGATITIDCPAGSASPAPSASAGATATPRATSTTSPSDPGPTSSPDSASPSPAAGPTGSIEAATASPEATASPAAPAPSASAPPTSPVSSDGGSGPLLGIGLAVIAIVAVGGGAAYWRSRGSAELP